MSGRGTLQSVKPIKADLIPPQDAVVVGTTPDGKVLYERTRRMARAVPKIDPKTGEQAWRRDPNGQPLVPLNQPEIFTRTDLFYLEDQKNGNVELMPYYPPSAAEVAAKKRAADISATKDALAEAIVDSGLTTQEAIARLMGGKTVTAVDVPVPAAATAPKVIDLAEYPVHVAGAKWLLSDGSAFMGKRDAAEKAEKKVTDEMRAAAAEAKANADATPEQ